MAKGKRSMEQKEFDGMPEHTPLGKKAIEYLNAKEASDKAKNEADGVKAELIAEFIKSGLTTVKVSGHQFAYSHKESETVVVKEAL